MGNLTKEGYCQDGFIDRHYQNVEFIGRKLALHAWETSRPLDTAALAAFPEYTGMREAGRYHVQQFLVRSKLFNIDTKKKEFVAQLIALEPNSDAYTQALKKIDAYRKYIHEHHFIEQQYDAAPRGYQPGEERPTNIEHLREMVAKGDF
ncbi:hypothetical protein ACFSFZ_20660 [Mixta tenebrionis]|uniref:Uncharacterized protein n=1 Tax=Mixta tenebrionis TaxID=2562439 RepID=A0A506V6J4_9GAMM|nr:MULTISPECIES: hypothetical protein [Mixta]QHM78055.1 hypothetical protein C7M52_04086 [Mixta theicola]TPW41032.1 hypothetical protein FKM52_16190 [Mixta tenebrionis]